VRKIAVRRFYHAICTWHSVMALMRLNFLGRMEKPEEPWKKFTTRVPAFRSWDAKRTRKDRQSQDTLEASENHGTEFLPG